MSMTMQQHDRIRVFLVDDQAIVGEQVRRMLDGEPDIELLFCSNPEEAIAQAAAFQPTTILQDLVMPGVEGMTLVRFFKGHPALREVPLIVLSSREEPITKSDAFAAGANDYLVKLPDRLELLARIRYHSKAYAHLLERNEAYEALKASQEELAAELASAAEYVVSLLPPPLDDQDLRTTWKFIPSARLGGDSFGYHRVDGEHTAFYLLDVCDHGVGPALLSVSVINVLRSQSLNRVDFRDPSAVLSALNQTFQMEKNNDLYFTLWYGVFHHPTRKLRFAAGGHPPALLFTPEGSVTELHAPGMIVGGMPESVYAPQETSVPPGASMYVFSDGVYEIAQPDGGTWPFHEYAHYLGELRQRAPDRLFEVLYEHVLDMSGASSLDDDFSIMEITFKNGMT